jgi:hypothetical protein
MPSGEESKGGEGEETEGEGRGGDQQGVCFDSHEVGWHGQLERKRKRLQVH